LKNNGNSDSGTCRIQTQLLTTDENNHGEGMAIGLSGGIHTQPRIRQIETNITKKGDLTLVGFIYITSNNRSKQT
jgi:hypothetical protein